MRKSGRFTVILVLVAPLALAVAVAAEGDASRAQLRPALMKAQPIERMTKEQFDALPETAAIEVKGKALTKGEYIGGIARREKQWHARADLLAKSAGERLLEAQRARLLEERRARIAKNNAKMRAEFERLKGRGASGKAQRIDAIRVEARKLQVRWRAADPAERERLEKRAAELLRQVNQAGD